MHSEYLQKKRKGNQDILQITEDLKEKATRDFLTLKTTVLVEFISSDWSLLPILPLIQGIYDMDLAGRLLLPKKQRTASRKP